MRSTTVFVGFGAVLIILLLWIIFTNVATSNDPVMRTTKTFLAAIARQDATATEQMVDPNTVKITKVGNKITSFDFAEMHGRGALSVYPANLWTYTDLLTLTIDPDASPDVADEQGLATIPMAHNVKMYLRRIGKSEHWKVIYITSLKSNADSQH